MISDFQNVFVPLQKSLIASSSMAFACNAVERIVERVGHVRGALVAVARATGRVRGGGATNADALESKQECEKAAVAQHRSAVDG